MNPDTLLSPPRRAAAPLSTPPAELPAGQLARRLAAMLDQVGHGLLLLDASACVLHANRLAESALKPGHALALHGGRLQARSAADAARLQAALDAALQRGLRQLLTLGSAADAGGRVSAAVIPVEDACVLLVLEQPRGLRNLALQGYAREHGLTAAEAGVLQALAAGDSVAEVAAAKGVALSTVRSQIGQLRLKTGAHSIRALLDRVAALPPMLAVVQ